MAEPKKNTAADDRVDLYIPFEGGKADPNVYIGVNGVGYLLPKGKTSKVPAAVAEEYHRSQRAKEAYYTKEQELVEQSTINTLG